MLQAKKGSPATLQTEIELRTIRNEAKANKSRSSSGRGDLDMLPHPHLQRGICLQKKTKKKKNGETEKAVRPDFNCSACLALTLCQGCASPAAAPVAI